MLSFMFSLMIPLTNVMFVGHYLSTSALDAVGISSSFINVFGQRYDFLVYCCILACIDDCSIIIYNSHVCNNSVGVGLGSAADTLGSQAFGCVD